MKKPMNSTATRMNHRIFRSMACSPLCTLHPDSEACGSKVLFFPFVGSFRPAGRKEPTNGKKSLAGEFIRRLVASAVHTRHRRDHGRLYRRRKLNIARNMRDMLEHQVD